MFYEIWSHQSDKHLKNPVANIQLSQNAKYQWHDSDADFMYLSAIRFCGYLVSILWSTEGLYYERLRIMCSCHVWLVRNIQ